MLPLRILQCDRRLASSSIGNDQGIEITEALDHGTDYSQAVEKERGVYFDQLSEASLSCVHSIMACHSFNDDRSAGVRSGVVELVWYLHPLFEGCARSRSRANVDQRGREHRTSLTLIFVTSTLFWAPS
jgi:hypothetical protein